MDVYFSDQVNDPTLRLFSSTKTLKESLDDTFFEDDPVIASAIAAATSGSCMEISDILKRQKEKRENNTNSTENIVSKQNDQNDPRKNINNSMPVKSSTVNQTRPDTAPVETSISASVLRKNTCLTPDNKTSDSNTIDQYLLSWNNFLGNMSRGFHILQKDEKMVDVTIAAGGKIFKAHKLVLSVCSPYFQEIFLENPSNHPILLMADVEANHMAGLLNFMYSGQVNVKYEDLPTFLKVAEAMKIKGLHTERPDKNKVTGTSKENITNDLNIMNTSNNYSFTNNSDQMHTKSFLKEESVHSPRKSFNSDQLKISDSMEEKASANISKQVKKKILIPKAFSSGSILSRPNLDNLQLKRKSDDIFEKNLEINSKQKLHFANVQDKQQAQSCNNIPTDQVLNLAQNGMSNILSIRSEDLRDICHYEETSFILNDSHLTESIPEENKNNSLTTLQNTSKTESCSLKPDFNIFDSNNNNQTKDNNLQMTSMNNFQKEILSSCDINNTSTKNISNENEANKDNNNNISSEINHHSKLKISEKI